MELNDIKHLSDIQAARGRGARRPRARPRRAGRVDPSSACRGSGSGTGRGCSGCRRCACRRCCCGRCGSARRGCGSQEGRRQASCGRCGAERRRCTEEGRRQEVATAGMSARSRDPRERCGSVSYCAAWSCNGRHSAQDHRRSRQSGPRARATRHNAGFWFVDALAAQARRALSQPDASSRARSAARSCRAATCAAQADDVHESQRAVRRARSSTICKSRPPKCWSRTTSSTCRRATCA